MQETFYHNLVSSHFLCEKKSDHKAIPRTKKNVLVLVLCAVKNICNKMLLNATYMKSIINKNNSILGLKDKRKSISVKPYFKVINLPLLPKLILDDKVFLSERL